MIRLNKYLQLCGIASRRKSDELIFSGQVRVNGQIVDTPFTRIQETDTVTVNHKPIKKEEEKVYFLLNKPKGYLCTNAPGNRRVIDLFKAYPYRLFTVGRLDKDTEGLILVTNDGDFAQRVIHPSHDIEKEYIAQVNEPLTEQHLKQIAKGTRVEEVFVKPILVEKMKSDVVKIIVSEGKKREVRCLIADAGLETVALKRVRIGNLHLGALQVGHFRPLKPSEFDF